MSFTLTRVQPSVTSSSQSYHDYRDNNLAAWALAYELGDSAVRDRGIVEELSALLQEPWSCVPQQFV